MNIKKVSVDKEGTGMGWGAVYAQYLESMDQISGQGNGLSVSRQLYKGATQALSVAAGQGVFSLGRVQTPTLEMCIRDSDNS